MIKLTSLLITSLLFTVSLHVQATNEDATVKQSSSGICHDNSSRFYKRTKKYTAYDSISACINAGGRLPKSATKQMDKAVNEALEQGPRLCDTLQ